LNGSRWSAKIGEYSLSTILAVGCYAMDSGRYPKWQELGFVFRIFLQCYEVGLAEKGLKVFRDLSVDDMVEKAC
jgi:hypothetical protein